MAFNTTSSSEKRAMVNPKNLRFTQPNVKSTFTDPTHPSVRDTACLMQRGQLSPDALGSLHISTDKHGRIWCDNNRRLFAHKEAGVDSVPVVFDGNRRPKNSVKSTLDDPGFMPRIRGESSGVQIPQPPTSGRNAHQMQKEPSLRCSVSAGYSERQMYNIHQEQGALKIDYEYSYSYKEKGTLKVISPYKDQEKLEARFRQLDIKPAFSGPTYPTHRESVSSKQWGEVNPDVFGNPIVHRDQNRSDSVSVNFYGNQRRRNVVESKRNDPALMRRSRGGVSGVQIPPPPSSGWNAYQMEKETSLLGPVSAGYSKSQVYNRHQEHEVHYKYSYEGHGALKNEYPYEDEGKVEYVHTVFSEDEVQ
ncbi:uncharacterized protein LOC131047162 [Cryptomeria japonica]|uniref:uncharacterized protein LOC131047162 n=1 Tax=Cryptomeria japonica TaxID=3369 RepID=UPI0027DA3CE3|nr:uncharacterized protein LOC131047162 [Cryptomeria japonica]